MMRRILLAAVLVAFGAGCAHAANEKPGQWRDHCAPDEITKKRVCTAYAILKGANGKMVAALFASAMGKGVYRVQASGADDAKWSTAELRVGDRPAVATTRCKRAICTFPAAESDVLIKRMMTAREAQIRFTDPAAPERSATMPLAGFAEAFGRAEGRLRSPWRKQNRAIERLCRRPRIARAESARPAGSISLREPDSGSAMQRQG